MAVIQVNTPGMAATDEGYIVSITVRSAGADVVLVPDATTGQITVAALAATKLVQDHSRIKLITG
jgi:hypothetical protein